MLRVKTGVPLSVSGVVVFGALAATAVLAALLAPAARGPAVAVVLSAWFAIAFALAQTGAPPLAQHDQPEVVAHLLKEHR